jgi:putative peptidoglycan lipid II flippase
MKYLFARLHTSLLSALSLLSSALGFLNLLILARVFGIGSKTDSYFYALSLPSFIAALFIAFFTYSSVPILLRSGDQDNSSRALYIVSLFFSSIFFLLSLSYISSYILSLSFAPNTIKYDSLLFSIAWACGGLQIVFGSLSAIFNSQRYFFTPLMLSSLGTIGSLAGSLLSISNLNIVIPLIGLFAGTIIANLIGFFLLRGLLCGFRKTKLSDIKKLILGNAGFLGTLLATSSFGAFVVIDAYLAPRFGVGSLSTLAFAQRIVIGFGGVAVYGIFSKVGPLFSEIYDKEDFSGLRPVVIKVTAKVAALSSFLAGFVWFNVGFLTTTIFTNKFQSANLPSLVSLFSYMLPGMIFMLCSTVLLRAVLCIKNSNLHVLLFGIIVPSLYFFFCWLLAPLGISSFGISYLISWAIGFSILASRLCFPIFNVSRKSFC